ncbi:hypothetical protein FRC17_002823 [Serendipita sp. 399]|nr:hypothetical protein FRC17_002823 [Serendipita sp. 399]
MAPSPVQAFDIDPAFVFPAPPTANKRQLVPDLLHGVATVVDNVANGLAGGAGLTTTTTRPAAPLTSAAVSTPANPGGGGGGGNAPAPSSTTTTNNNGGNPPAPSSTAVGPANTGDSSENAKSTTLGGTVVPINAGANLNGLTRTTPPQVVTDHNGHLLTITGPYTTTYVTTLPNGVVSTVTEVITPTSYVAEPNNSNRLSASKIGAVVGTLVAVFLILFGVALLCLHVRKRRRAIQLTRSRPASASSFGSVTDEFAHEDRRHSQAPLVDDVARTVPAMVDGSNLNFPLPPVPAATNGSSPRPTSMLSSQTFDLAFEQQTKSRSSLIADRNLFRKIGQYPDAGTYTPFAVPPSETSHAEHAISPTQLNRALEREQGYNELYRVIQTDKQVTAENPFSDPVPTATTSSQAAANYSQLLSNTEARRTTLWRKATFGSSAPSARGNNNDSATKSPSMRSTHTSSEYGTALSHPEEAAAGEDRRVSDAPSAGSAGGYSYHSAFEAYARGTEVAKEAENPFADPQQPAMASGDTITLARIAYPTLRPGTASSSGKSSTKSSIAQSREMGATPDPRELFYQASPPGTANPPATIPAVASTSANAALTINRADSRHSTRSEVSTASGSDDEGTVRGHSVSYAYPIPPSVARLQSDTAAP